MAAASSILLIIFSSSLCFYLLSNLFKFLDRVWLTPMRIQRLMTSQGIRGPSCRFIYGSTKEIIKMRNQSMSTSMKDLSHDMFSRIQPYFHSWTNTYGTQLLIPFFFLFCFNFYSCSMELIYWVFLLLLFDLVPS